MKKPATAKAKTPQRRQATPEEAQAKAVVAGYLEDLCAEVELGESEKLLGYLEFISTFRSYSFHNNVLVLRALPTARFISSLADWKNRGMKLKEGAAEHPIRIWAPLTGTRRTPESNPGWSGENPLSLYRSATGLDRKAVAGRLGVKEYTVGLWESGAFIPYPRFLAAMQALMEEAVAAGKSGGPRWEKLLESRDGNPDWLSGAWQGWMKKAPPARGKTVRSFRLTSVFDVSQVEPEDPEKPVPAFFEPLDFEDRRELENIVRRVAGFEGPETDVFPAAPGKEGRFAPAVGEMDGTNRIISMARAMAARNITEKFEGNAGAPAAEILRCWAEAAAYAFCRHAGIYSPYAADMVALWSSMETQSASSEETLRKARLKALKEGLTVVTKTTDEMINAFEKERGKTPAKEAPRRAKEPVLAPRQGTLFPLAPEADSLRVETGGKSAKRDKAEKPKAESPEKTLSRRCPSSPPVVSSQDSPAPPEGTAPEPATETPAEPAPETAGNKEPAPSAEEKKTEDPDFSMEDVDLFSL